MEITKIVIPIPISITFDSTPAAALIFGENFMLPEKSTIDRRLVSGAALFGVGWGLSGYCPGPALVSLVTGNPSLIVFVLSMLAGLGIGQWVNRQPSA